MAIVAVCSPRRPEPGIAGAKFLILNVKIPLYDPGLWVIMPGFLRSTYSASPRPRGGPPQTADGMDIATVAGTGIFINILEY